MADRMTHVEAWSRIEIPLQNGEVAEKGHMACVDTADGTAVAGQAAEGIIPIGYFEESFTGNGTRTIGIRLFKEIWLHRFANDTAPNAVAEADRLQHCFIKDSQTVSMLGTSRSIAGRVWLVTSRGVLIEPAISIGVPGPQGEPGE